MTVTGLIVTITVSAAVVAAFLAWLLTRLSLKARYARELTAAQAALETEKALRANDASAAAERLNDLKAAQEQALEATKKELALQSEKALREREESLKRRPAK